MVTDRSSLLVTKIHHGNKTAIQVKYPDGSFPHSNDIIDLLGHNPNPHFRYDLIDLIHQVITDSSNYDENDPYLYIASSDNYQGLMKVGHTKNVDIRMRQIKSEENLSSAPVPHVIFQTPFAKKLEKMLHRLYKKEAVYKEWYPASLARWLSSYFNIQELDNAIVSW